jgi:hypothetical protein
MLVLFSHSTHLFHFKYCVEWIRQHFDSRYFAIISNLFRLDNNRAIFGSGAN